MNKNVAEKLHSGDEVKIKKTGEIKTVIETDVTNKSVVVTCDDGEKYHHKDLL
ncbi:hypothetical protein [Thomasclavelia cocleata]|jgi:hypothetical protein|uniref:hypothetical protein n=1 Tax=Thomasclavelia cocleata TaxID=69824 RepID=UPI00256EF2E8|nr:hypothetical protein [Thomasclavelia cocleata]